MEQFYKIMLELMLAEKVDVKTYRNADATSAYFINNRFLNYMDQIKSGALQSEFAYKFSVDNLADYIKEGGLDGPIEGSVLVQDYSIDGKTREPKILAIDDFKRTYVRQSSSEENKFFRDNLIMVGAEVPNWLVVGDFELEGVSGSSFYEKVTKVKAGDKILFPFDPMDDIKKQLEEYVLVGADQPYWTIDREDIYKQCDGNGWFLSSDIYDFYEQDDEHFLSFESDEEDEFEGDFDATENFDDAEDEFAHGFDGLEDEEAEELEEFGEYLPEEVEDEDSDDSNMDL